MNEQIKKLAKQAYEDVIKNTPSFLVTKELYEQRFAELLIKECITIVNEQKECLHEEQKYWHDRDYGYEMAVNDASKGIKQFFGVEE